MNLKASKYTAIIKNLQKIYSKLTEISRKKRNLFPAYRFKANKT